MSKSIAEICPKVSLEYVLKYRWNMIINNNKANKSLLFWSANDFLTENTTDTWVPVLTNNKVQHRVIPTNLLTKSDIVNNLTSTSTTKPLSANQGRVLSSKQVKRKVIAKSINGDYVVLSPAEVGIGNTYIIDVNIHRAPHYGYHFVVGHGVDASGNLYVYFDGPIRATVDIMIHYVSI